MDITAIDTAAVITQNRPTNVFYVQNNPGKLAADQ